jgi:hypothetical protein
MAACSSQEGDASGARRAGAQLCRLAIRPVLVVVAAKCALHLVVAGRHLQGGYVEFPPVTAWLSALARVVFGWSLVGFRAFAILAGAATIVVAALVARDLGGGGCAQTLAAVAVGFSPILVATNGLFQPVSFDQLATMMVLVAVPVAVAGTLALVRDRALRPLGWTVIGTVVAYLVLGGKSYYALVVVTSNYGEAGALELFGRGLPPVASGDVTFRYWRPRVSGRRAVLVGFAPGEASFCGGYQAVARIQMPVDNEERGQPIARCTLDGSLAQVWPRIVAQYDPP